MVHQLSAASAELLCEVGVRRPEVLADYIAVELHQLAPHLRPALLRGQLHLLLYLVG